MPMNTEERTFDYETVRFYDIDKLNEYVKKQIKQDNEWRPVGGVQIYTDLDRVAFVQTLVKVRTIPIF